MVLASLHVQQLQLQSEWPLVSRQSLDDVGIVLHPGTNNDDVIDEGSEEQMKKKMKVLEDKIEKLAGTNAALTNTVRVLQKEKAHYVQDDRGNSDGGNNNGDDDGHNNSDSDDSLTLFSSQKVRIHFHRVQYVLSRPWY